MPEAYKAPGEDKIRAKCLTLAKLLLKEGSPWDKSNFVPKLVERAFKGSDKVSQAKAVYDWLTKNKVEGAWELSGLGMLTVGNGESSS